MKQMVIYDRFHHANAADAAKLVARELPKSFSRVLGCRSSGLFIALAASRRHSSRLFPLDYDLGKPEFPLLAHGQPPNPLEGGKEVLQMFVIAKDPIDNSPTGPHDLRGDEYKALQKSPELHPQHFQASLLARHEQRVPGFQIPSQ